MSGRRLLVALLAGWLAWSAWSPVAQAQYERRRGKVMWQAAGLGLGLGGFFGFAAGAHIDSRTGDHESPGPSAALLTLSGGVGGAVGGLLVGRRSDATPGNSAWPAAR